MSSRKENSLRAGKKCHKKGKENNQDPALFIVDGQWLGGNDFEVNGLPKHFGKERGRD